MAYDRYLAICCPLVYRVALSRGCCLLLAAISWVGAFFPSGLITALIVRLPVCSPNYINHVNCELLMVIKLGCTDTSLVKSHHHGGRSHCLASPIGRHLDLI